MWDYQRKNKFRELAKACETKPGPEVLKLQRELCASLGGDLEVFDNMDNTWRLWYMLSLLGARI